MSADGPVQIDVNAPSDKVKVLHVPTRHSYVDHIQWERPTRETAHMRAVEVLNVSWLEANLGAFNVVHVHFQIREVEPVRLLRSIDFIRNAHVHLAFTVHDLVDPQAESQVSHLANLDALIESADSLFTLTESASRQIQTEWGRPAAVIPHPHVLPLELIHFREQRGKRLPVVGVHLKSGRPGVVGISALLSLIEVHDPAQWILRIDINHEGEEILESREPGFAELLRGLEKRPSVVVCRHPRFSNAEFYEYLDSISIAILPYRLGTHSGWAEACLDAGVVVLAPSHTHIPAQHPSVISFDLESTQSLQAAMHTALTMREYYPWTPESRALQRRLIVEMLGAAYSHKDTGTYEQEMLNLL